MVQKVYFMMTGEFSQFAENSVHLSTSVLSLATGLAREQVNLELDPVLHVGPKL